MMQDKFFIIWQRLDDTQEVVVSEFVSAQEAKFFFTLLASTPTERSFIAFIKGSKVLVRL